MSDSEKGNMTTEELFRFHERAALIQYESAPGTVTRAQAERLAKQQQEEAK